MPTVWFLNKALV